MKHLRRMQIFSEKEKPVELFLIMMLMCRCAAKNLLASLRNRGSLKALMIILGKTQKNLLNIL